MLSINGGPPRDAAFSVMHSREVNTGKLNVFELFIRGVPLDDYIYEIVNQGAFDDVDDLSQQISHPHPLFTTSHPTHSLNSQPSSNPDSFPRTPTRILDNKEHTCSSLSSSWTPSASSTPDSASIPNSPASNSRSSTLNRKEFVQVSARAGHAHVADTAHSYFDPVNAHKGFLLTCDESGQGSWLPPPSTGDVEGPLQSHIDSVAVFDSKQGNLLRDSCVLIRDLVLSSPVVETKELRLLTESGQTGDYLVRGENGKLEWKNAWFNSWKKDFENLGSKKGNSQSHHIGSSSDGNLTWKPSLSVQNFAPKRLLKLSSDPAILLPSSAIEETDSGQVIISEVSVKKLFLPSFPPGHFLTVGESGKISSQKINSDTVLWKNANSVVTSSEPLLPVVQNGKLCVSSIEVHDGKHIKCDSLLTNNVTSVELKGTSAIIEKFVGKEAIIDEISAEHLYTMELHLPRDASPGYILVCDEKGCGRWEAPPRTTTPYPTPVSLPESILHGPSSITKSNSLAQFSTKNELQESQVSVGDQGELCVSRLIVQESKRCMCIADGGVILSADCESVSVGTGSEIHTSQTVAIGSGALSQCVASSTVAIGFQSLSHLTSGNGNTAVGWKSLFENDQGENNTALGQEVLARCTLGSGNTAVGSGSLLMLVHGSGNVAVGINSGDKIVDGDSNTILGSDAGPSSDCSNSICLGQGAKCHLSGELSLASKESPLRLSKTATSGDLTGLNPVMYLPVTLNGIHYKIALYLP